jgi:folate-binding Fe-S cluster repair protein YgfZ
MLYKLRAKAEISVDDQTLVAPPWEMIPALQKMIQADWPTRVSGRMRFYASMMDKPPKVRYGHWHRCVSQCVAESGSDYALSDAFPHDVLLDQMEGVGFGKGLLCRPGGRFAHAASRHCAATCTDRGRRGYATLPPPQKSPPMANLSGR